jgi:hypothetical protein
MIAEWYSTMSLTLFATAKRLLALVILLGSFPIAAAAATAGDFSDISQRPAIGVTVRYSEFGCSSPPAQIGDDIGAGVTQLAPECALVGYADGVLALIFSQPVVQASFAVAETTSASLMQSAEVDTSLLVRFSECEYTNDGPLGLVHSDHVLFS